VTAGPLGLGNLAPESKAVLPQKVFSVGEGPSGAILVMWSDGERLHESVITDRGDGQLAVTTVAVGSLPLATLSGGRALVVVSDATSSSVELVAAGPDGGLVVSDPIPMPTGIVPGPGLASWVCVVPNGDLVLLVGTCNMQGIPPWDPHSNQPEPPQQALVLHATGNALTASAPFEMPIIVQGSPPGLAVGDGDGFSLVTPDYSTSSPGLLIQHLDATGAAQLPSTARTGPVSELPVVAAYPLSSTVVGTPAGLAVGWYAEPPPAWSFHATLLADDGTVLHDAILGGDFEGFTLLPGHLLVSAAKDAGTVEITDLGWLGEAPSTSTVPMTAPPSPPYFFEAGGQVFTDNGSTVYATGHDDSFSSVWTIPSDGALVTADGCGHVLNVGPQTDGTFGLVQVWRSTARASFGGSLPVGAPVTAPTSTGLAVAWVGANRQVEVTTLSWE
jgi:hypothetical protein